MNILQCYDKIINNTPEHSIIRTRVKKMFDETVYVAPEYQNVKFISNVLKIKNEALHYSKKENTQIYDNLINICDSFINLKTTN